MEHFAYAVMLFECSNDVICTLHKRRWVTIVEYDDRKWWPDVRYVQTRQRPRGPESLADVLELVPPAFADPLSLKDLLIVGLVKESQTIEMKQVEK